MKSLFSALSLSILTIIITVPFTTTASETSGTIEQGYRVIDVTNDKKPFTFTVFRGDYLKFRLAGFTTPPSLSLPLLKVKKTLEPDLAKASYIKMKKVGIFDATIADKSGKIKVVEYAEPHYQAIGTQEAATLIDNFSPFVLDVRTRREFARGHLANALNIPLQEIQRRVHELQGKKEEILLIYCATGNRSTVASKLLLDQGFTRIYNLRTGIYDWHRQGFPVTR